jgi:hypothetical protein
MIRSRRMGACSTHGSDENGDKILVPKSEWKTPLRTSIWKDNIKMDFGKEGCKTGN